MVHDMQLNDAPFRKMQCGEKDIELRLYDEKRSKLNINDLIVFTDTSDPTQRVAVIITALHRYASFESLFSDLSPNRCGFNFGTGIAEASNQMQQYYSTERIAAFGVLGIEVKVVDLSYAEKLRAEDVESRSAALFPDGMR